MRPRRSLGLVAVAAMLVVLVFVSLAPLAEAFTYTPLPITLITPIQPIGGPVQFFWGC